MVLSNIRLLKWLLLHLLLGNLLLGDRLMTVTETRIVRYRE